MKQKVRGIGVGTISLIMIFSVLCLTIFAMLTLSTANAEKILSDRTSSFVKGYYEADSEATKIKAGIFESYLNGTLPDSVRGTDIEYEVGTDGFLASFTLDVNEVQRFVVKLSIKGMAIDVLEWRIDSAGDWEYEDSLNVFDPGLLEIFL